MAALINMAMLYCPLCLLSRAKNSSWITFPFSAPALDTFPIRSATSNVRLSQHFSQSIRRPSRFSMHPKGALRELFSTPPWFRWTPLSRAARAGASDCAGFAPNKTQTRLSLTALSLAPCHPHNLRSVPFTVPSVFVRWRSSEEQKQAGNGRKEKTMKLEEINVFV